MVVCARARVCVCVCVCVFGTECNLAIESTRKKLPRVRLAWAWVIELGRSFCLWGQEGTLLIPPRVWREFLNRSRGFASERGGRRDAVRAAHRGGAERHGVTDGDCERGGGTTHGPGARLLPSGRISGA